MHTETASQPERGRLAFSMERTNPSQGAAALVFKGQLSLEEAPALWARLRKLRRVRSGSALDLDLSMVDRIDGGAMALLVHFRAELLRRGARCEFVGARPQVQELVHLYRGEDASTPRRPRRRPRGLLDQIGGVTIAIVLEAKGVLAFLGDIMLAGLRAARRPRSINWKDLPAIAERCGADAVPIIMLINFLLGLVIALQSEQQLRRFGADIYMADLVGISVVREIAPLMTAIIVCGRSGAAFAAELGSMAINEEIDALRTMSFDPMRFLVLPRVLALVATVPLLVIVADLCGGLGGLLIAVSHMHLAPAAYINETHHAVKLGDFCSGLVKSGAFGMAIGLVACQQGLATRGGAEALGRRTTSAVVTTLFSLIVIDAASTFIFEATKAS